MAESTVSNQKADRMNPREIRNNINNIFLSSSYIHPVNTAVGGVVDDAVYGAVSGAVSGAVGDAVGDAVRDAVDVGAVGEAVS